MNTLKHVGWLFIASLVILTACSSLSSSASKGIKANTWYPVEKVIDNNTFEIIVNDEIEYVSFLSLDIPNTETSKQYNLPIKDFLEDRLLSSAEVKLTFDKEMRNAENQLLAIVTLKDGSNLNEQLLEMGYGKVLIKEPNVLNENIYKQLEQLAKTNHNGIWSNEAETSNVDVSIIEKVFSGISLSVDKNLQLAHIYNYTGQTVDLNNWMLVSVTGNETHLFESIILEPGEHVTVYATSEIPSNSESLVYWGDNLVWDTNEKEIAELYNKNKELMAIWSE